MITLGNLTGFVRGSDCTGKVGFGSYAEAEREIGRLLRKNAARLGQGTLAPYFCGRCLKFHLGHIREEG